MRKTKLVQTEKIIQHIVNWLKDYAKESDAKGFVIGVSGGIDSAVTSVLGAKTNLPILCVEMTIYQSTAQMDKASNHLKYLKETKTFGYLKPSENLNFEKNRKSVVGRTN